MPTFRRYRTGAGFRVGHRLRFELEGHYSARRGGWRLIYRVDEKKQLVHIERVGHRSDVYRRR